MQEQMGNLSRKMEILRKNQKGLTEILKNTVTEMKNIFDGFICRPNMAEKIITELENISNRSLQI